MMVNNQSSTIVIVANTANRGPSNVLAPANPCLTQPSPQPYETGTITIPRQTGENANYEEFPARGHTTGL